MKKESVKKIIVVDQGHPVFFQMMTKARKLFGTDDVDYIRLSIPIQKDEPATMEHMRIIAQAEAEIKKINPDLVLIGATALGEELAPALGIRFGTGVAAHCIDIGFSDGEIAFMVPAFGGKVIGEIFIPKGRPSIATINNM